jgi:hypothetical protein
MRKLLLVAFAMTITLVLSGCGGGTSSPPPTFEAQILSNPSNDGDIEVDINGVAFPPTQGDISVFTGINVANGHEFRAFLDFPLTGSGGVPGNAVIISASLDLFIDSIFPGATSVPLRFELVSFPPQTLLPSDFDRISQPPLAFVRSIVVPSDVGHHVTFNVTPLMVQAQISGLVNFQIRILEDFGAPGALVEINDNTVSRAPLLEVTYH